mmetsp:Transcript_1848/g.4751  ORF Transcript_1848/g.4751 Transcript_1848/m.4751 type:complete len:202 (+) Transcript_1848:395-1000(+)
MSCATSRSCPASALSPPPTMAPSAPGSWAVAASRCSKLLRPSSTAWRCSRAVSGSPARRTARCACGMQAAASVRSPSCTPRLCGAAPSCPTVTWWRAVPTATPTSGRGRRCAWRRPTSRWLSRRRWPAPRSPRSRRRACRRATTRCSTSTRRRCSSPVRVRASRSSCSTARASSGSTSGPPPHSRGRRSARSRDRTTRVWG